MEAQQMVHMANQIAMFFSGYPHDEALAGVTNHFKQFWERRMRDQIKHYVAQGGGGLHELALEAVKRLG
jgi:formate dehydrogenase subunit delta